MNNNTVTSAYQSHILRAINLGQRYFLILRLRWIIVTYGDLEMLYLSMRVFQI